MTIKTSTVPYEHAGDSLNGFLAWDDAAGEPRPLVLVSHAWGGQTDQEREIAKYIAGLGYTAFALDLFGRTGKDRDENRALMTPFLEDRAKLQSRMTASLEVARAQAPAAHAAAAIGFCFGGLCVLDLARIGTDLRGVVSFHGLFHKPDVGKAETIPAKVLILHGWDDPMAPPESVLSITEEMTAAKADWRLHAFGHTMHAFTNPAANDPDFGTVYNERAANLSWKAMEDFLTEIL